MESLAAHHAVVAAKRHLITSKDQSEKRLASYDADRLMEWTKKEADAVRKTATDEVARASMRPDERKEAAAKVAQEAEHAQTVKAAAQAKEAKIRDELAMQE